MCVSIHGLHVHVHVHYVPVMCVSIHEFHVHVHSTATDSTLHVLYGRYPTAIGHVYCRTRVQINDSFKIVLELLQICTILELLEIWKADHCYKHMLS